MEGYLRILSLRLLKYVFNTSANIFTLCLVIIHEALFPENFQVYIACMFSESVISECPKMVTENIANLPSILVRCRVCKLC